MNVPCSDSSKRSNSYRRVNANVGPMGMHFKPHANLLFRYIIFCRKTHEASAMAFFFIASVCPFGQPLPSSLEGGTNY